MTPAEQYRQLVNRLEAIQEAGDPNIGRPGYTPATPLTSTPPRDFKIPPDQNRYPPKALGIFPTTEFQQRFQAHCLEIVKQFAQYVGSAEEKELLNLIQVEVTTNPELSAYALPKRGIVRVDYTQLGDAPDNVLKFLLAHEAGHVVMGHYKTVKPPQSRQEELDADSYAVQLLQQMGITKAPVFVWLHRKKDALGKTRYQDNLDWDQLNPSYYNTNSDKGSTHPSYPQRFDHAAQQGFELSRANTGQIDTLLAHMANMA